MRIARRLTLYTHTLRHLLPVQWIYLPVRRLQRGVPRGTTEFSVEWVGHEAPVARELRSWWSGQREEEALATADRLLQRRFRFLNSTVVLETVDWRAQYESRLWTYNLHYFDYAIDLAIAFLRTGRADYRRTFEELALGWIGPPESRTGPGWEPYTLSLRIVNWTFALLLFGEAIPTDSRHRLHQSLAAQTGALEKRIEHHIQGNHLVKNYLALAVAGLAFAGPDAARWRTLGLQGLWKESARQILPDGSHFERSPMYHAIVLNDFLWILGLCRAAAMEVPPEVTRRVQAMLRAAGALLHANGEPHRLQDSADRIAPRREQLAHLAGVVLGGRIPPAEGCFALSSAGYYGWADPARQEKLIVDCGDPAPDFQPGHAHCSLLSFEWEVGGRPVVVDSGVSGYEGDPFREYVRSTRAHNTISLDGAEQSEVWGTFRMGRRARVLRAAASGDTAEFEFRGAYRPYASKVVHEREIVRDPDQTGWIVRDRIEGGAGRSVSSFLHFHPDFMLEEQDGHFLATASDFRLVIETFGHTSSAIVRGCREPVQGWYCPEFGMAVPATVLELGVDAHSGNVLGYRIYLLSGNEA
jgi:uncharacterized heparinase superfamily protein